MQQSNSLACLLAILAITAVAALPATAHADGPWGQRPFSAMYVFGDSLSDAGNVLALYGQTQQEPAPVPVFPYEGGRYTNGKVWVEILADQLRLPWAGRPALKSPFFTNFAFGQANVSGSGPLPVPDFAGQIDLLFERRDRLRHRQLPRRALYVVSFGGNELLTASLIAQEVGGEVGFQLGLEYLGNSIVNLRAGIERLRSRGAETFLVPNAPNPSATPAAALGAPGSDAIFDPYTAHYNSLLAAMLADLESEGATVFALDQGPLGAAQFTFPAGFGYTDVTFACLPPFTNPVTNPSGMSCENQNEYLFYDGVHPTTAGHNLFANVAYNILGLRR